jgi:hypothetical protein
MFDRVELGVPPQYDDGTGFSVIAGPAAEPCEDPSGVSERALGMRIFLLLGFAFEAFADLLKHGHVIGIEGVRERPPGGAIALRHKLHRGDGGDKNGRHQLLQRSLLLVEGFDLEAFGLRGPEQLLDGPALAVEANDAPRG